MELTIEKMVYGGEGLARIQQCGDARAETLFAPFVLPGERVEVVPIDRKSGFTRARLERVISPSPERVQPGCPYFYQCGGCQYQHSNYEHQLKIKEAILRETLLRTAKIDWRGEIKAHPSPPWNYRNRTSMKVQHTPFAMGYYKFGSHELLPVELCPISSPLINRAIGTLWMLGREGILPSSINEIELFVNAQDAELLLESYEDERNQSEEGKLAAFAKAVREQMPEIGGVVPFTSSRNGASEPRGMSKKLKADFGKRELNYETQHAAYRVSGGSFFQVNRFMVDELISAAVAGHKGQSALDLYAGVGLFSLPLSKRFKRVTAVESAPNSFSDLRTNSGAKVEARQSSTDKYLAETRERFDFVLVDPPRAGLGKQVAERLVKLAAPSLTYVSCDPATLARDLQILIAGGYQIRELHLVDLFPQTFHLETIVHLSR